MLSFGWTLTYLHLLLPFQLRDSPTVKATKSNLCYQKTHTFHNSWQRSLEVLTRYYQSHILREKSSLFSTALLALGRLHLHATLFNTAALF